MLSGDFPLRPGDRIPDFVLPIEVGMTQTLYMRHCGRPAAIVLTRAAGVSSLWTAVHRLESTVRYLGIEVDDALEISEQTEI